MSVVLCDFLLLNKLWFLLLGLCSSSSFWNSAWLLLQRDPRAFETPLKVANRLFYYRMQHSCKIMLQPNWRRTKKATSKCSFYRSIFSKSPFISTISVVDQGWGTWGPRAKGSPHENLIWPVEYKVVSKRSSMTTWYVNDKLREVTLPHT